MPLLTKPTYDEQTQLLAEIEECIAGCGVFSRGTLTIVHGKDDDMLPCIFDFLEARDCRVENVFTQVQPSGLYREILFKVCTRAVSSGPRL